MAPNPCLVCGGSGKIDCRTCGASGVVRAGEPPSLDDRPCPDCDGARTLKCGDCGGSGYPTREDLA